MTYTTGAWGPEAQKRSKKRVGYFKKYAEANKIRNQKWSAQLRLKVIEKLGGKCKHCGFDDPRALQIDHVNNDGYTERNLITTRVTYLNKVLKDKSGKYQLLCANCNWIKRYNINMEKREGVN
ncbi:MAG: hypothetical protein JW735_09170 [Prolixibacteraceae bacterium]|nr:hypothetical protein [Prolixibacteraceae bacterium]